MQSLSHRRFGLTWGIQWLVAMALWFAFVARFELAECLVGVVAAGAVALPAVPAGAVEVAPVDPVEPDFAAELAAAPATDIA